MKLILLGMTMMYSNICVAQLTEWHAGNIAYNNEYHFMVDVATKAILPKESPGSCVMRCMTSDIASDGSYVVTGIYEVINKNSETAKKYVRHSIYLRFGKKMGEFFYTTFTEKVDSKKFAKEYEYFKSKILKAKQQFKEPLDSSLGIVSIPTEIAVIEGRVPQSDTLFTAYIGDSEADPDFNQSDRKLLEFLHNKERPDEKSVWKFCKIAITIEETKEKPSAEEDPLLIP
jgi:hypothetical protein